MAIISSKTVLISISLIVVLVRTTKPPQQLLPFTDFSQYLEVDTVPHFGPGHSDVLTLLAKLSESNGVHQTANVKQPLPSKQTSGYLYAQYFTAPNCSTGSGQISFVEGYGTGICLATVDITSGQQSGSIMQSCSSSGVLVQNSSSLPRVAVSLTYNRFYTFDLSHSNIIMYSIS
jgi:hypothetical protein